MEPQNINRRFEKTQRKLRRRNYACIFISVFSILYTLIGLMAEFDFTKNRMLLITIILFACVLIYCSRKIEKRMQQNEIDANANKSIKHIKTRF